MMSRDTVIAILVVAAAIAFTVWVGSQPMPPAEPPPPETLGTTAPADTAVTVQVSA